MLTPEEVKKIANLARIELSEEEVEKYRQELSTILEYVEALKSVNTQGIEEVSQVTGLENVQRQDAVEELAKREDILSGAPQTKDEYFKVKSIL